MNNINLFRELIIVYGSTTVVSLIFNYFYYTRRANKALKEGERNLVFKDLSTTSSMSLSGLRDAVKSSNKLNTLYSLLPVAQVFHTINNINEDPDKLKNLYNECIEEINKQELLERKCFLRKIKKLNDVPTSIKEKLKDDKYLPSETEYIEALDYNNSDIIVKTKNLTIIRRKGNSK